MHLRSIRRLHAWGNATNVEALLTISGSVRKPATLMGGAGLGSSVPVIVIITDQRKFMPFSIIESGDSYQIGTFGKANHSREEEV